ncbi:MAG: hypothetical protein KZQ92_20130, partial [Candidatus Thiodiazotropha sp. (ex Lucinoma borealis)]|nr:hypothetical protein [Candidatus Thiodiazotropha sp. (ex Lucinoma borealis)]
SIRSTKSPSLALATITRGGNFSADQADELLITIKREIIRQSNLFLNNDIVLFLIHKSLLTRKSACMAYPR